MKDKKKPSQEEINKAKKIKVGAGIADEEIRKMKEVIHKGRPGEIGDEEIEGTDQKGFDKVNDN